MTSELEGPILIIHTESIWDCQTDRRKQRPDEYHQEQWPMLKASILVRVL